MAICLPQPFLGVRQDCVPWERRDRKRFGAPDPRIIACDFFVAVTATFRSLYVFVLIHHGSRQLLHFGVTAHPTAAWTLQQLREAIGFEAGYRYLALVQTGKAAVRLS